ncbi:MAG: STAS domain-containing protein [Nitrospirota bacterium]|nr:STAS domain-containing protein [Nitrospirota bacterium]
MLKTRTEQTGKTGPLVLEGELVVEHAEELKKILLEALKNGDSLDIDIEHVDQADLFGLQTLCSAHRSAMKAGKKLTLVGVQSEAFRNAVSLAGYGRAAACRENITCPWNRE